MNKQKVFLIVGAISALLTIGLYFYGTPLPPPTLVAPEILRGAPTQTETTTPLFSIDRGTAHYTFTPHATYTIPGLVVSLHHSDSVIDITHRYDPAQTVDICVVWGPNISTNGYRMVSYSHGDFTCYYQWHTEYDPPFSGNFLSNNHLVPATNDLARMIKSINVGDQIILSGLLVDYQITDAKVGVLGTRMTSLVRTDTGNGACEIIYLTDIKILKRNMPWRTPLINILIAITLGSIFIWFYLGIPKTYISTEKRDESHIPNPLDPRNFT